MAEVTYPAGMSEELAGRLYGRVKVDWSSSFFAFDPDRSECRFWLDEAMANTVPGSNYEAGTWPHLVNVIRRGDDNAVRVFQWSNGLVFQQRT